MRLFASLAILGVLGLGACATGYTPSPTLPMTYGGSPDTGTSTDYDTSYRGGAMLRAPLEESTSMMPGAR